MKKLFTLVAMTMMALGAHAALETVASYTVAEGDAVDGTDIAGTNCTIQLHTSDLKANADDATKLGAQLNSEQKYVIIDFAEALQAGDVVYFSYFVGSNPTADNTEGISIANARADKEEYVELAKLYVQTSDKKSIVTSGIVAKGGEKKYFVYRLASTTMFHAVKVVRGYNGSIDFTNPAINTKETAEANIFDAANLTIADTSDGSDGSAVAEWKNVAGQTASFSFLGAPISISYKNSSEKTFAKSRTTGFQFNSKGVYMKITCNAGAKIIITPASYSKDGSFNIVGGTRSGSTETTVSIPAGSTDKVEIDAAGSVTLNIQGAFLMEKVEIADSGFPTDPTGIQTVNRETKTAGSAVYNLAGQKVANDYKGLVIKDGKKIVVK